MPSFAALSRTVSAHRRLLSSVLAGLAVLLGVSAARPAAAPTVAVLAAARDLAPGAPLVLEDLRSVALPRSAVPSGALLPGAEVLGRVVAAPVRRGEPLTDVRLLGPSLLTAAAPPGAVAVPVRFADAGAVALLRPGDRIDVLAAPPGSVLPAHPEPPAGESPGRPRGPAAARVVAADVTVLVVTADDPGALGDGALVVVACSREVARALAAAGAADRLSPALRGAAAPAGSPRPP